MKRRLLHSPMCRYENQKYRNNHVCLNCRRAFKSMRFDGTKCPECGQLAICMGHDFKPPLKTSKNGWKKIGLFIEKGIKFHSCGCTGPGYKDKYKSLGDVKRA